MGGKGGGGSSTVHVDNGPITVDADSTVDLVGLDNISMKTDARHELVIPQPLRTENASTVRSDSNSTARTDSNTNAVVDLKPLAVDLCLSTSSKLPHGQVQQPFNYHFGMTLFGVELWGFNLGGQSSVILDDLPKRPAISWPAQHNVAAAPTPSRPDDAPVMQGGGLRIRVK